MSSFRCVFSYLLFLVFSFLLFSCEEREVFSEEESFRLTCGDEEALCMRVINRSDINMTNVRFQLARSEEETDFFSVMPGDSTDYFTVFGGDICGYNFNATDELGEAYSSTTICSVSVLITSGRYRLVIRNPNSSSSPGSIPVEIAED